MESKYPVIIKTIDSVIAMCEAKRTHGVGVDCDEDEGKLVALMDYTVCELSLIKRDLADA